MRPHANGKVGRIKAALKKLLRRGEAHPYIDGVLDHIVKGRVAYLKLTKQQRDQLHERRDGRLAYDVLRHMLGAREAAVQPDKLTPDFPYAPTAVQKIAALLGYGHIGLKRCYQMRRDLLDTSVIEETGSYRTRYSTSHPSGWRRPLHRVLLAFAPLRQQRLVGRRPRVKRGKLRVCWLHALFGTEDGRAPPEMRARYRKRTTGWMEPRYGEEFVYCR